MTRHWVTGSHHPKRAAGGVIYAAVAVRTTTQTSTTRILPRDSLYSTLRFSNDRSNRVRVPSEPFLGSLARQCLRPSCLRLLQPAVVNGGLKFQRQCVRFLFRPLFSIVEGHLVIVVLMFPLLQRSLRLGYQLRSAISCILPQQQSCQLTHEQQALIF